MPYTVTSDIVGLAIGPASETANDVHEASRVSSTPSLRLQGVNVTDKRDDPAAHVRLEVFGVDAKSSGSV